MSAVIIASVLVAFSAPAAAVYNFDGFELKTMTNGTVQGDVYVGGGHGTPNLGAGGENPENPYNQTFEVPAAAGTVKWARLYVGIWGGNAVGGGWLNVTYTNNTGIATTLKNITCGNPRGDWDNTPAYDSTNSSYNTGCGVWLVAINCTSNATSGTNTVNATTATSPWDGRVYGVVLVVVYENSSSPKVQYWVNEGNVDLHYPVSIGGSYHPALNNNVTWFNGTAYNSTEANLTVLYYTGDLGENDYLFMNAPNDSSDSPGNVSNDNIGWNNGSAYWRYQIDDKDVANERTDNCSVNYSSTHCDCSGAGCGGCCCDCEQQYYSTYGFDINCFSETNDSNYMLKDVINHTGNNYAIFWRGRDDNGNGQIDSTFEEGGTEGEAYVHPIVAVLRLDLDYDVSIASNTSSASGPACYEITITNTGNVTDTYDVSQESDPGVTVTLSKATTNELAPGESDIVYLTVSGGEEEESYKTTVTATSQADTTVTAEVEVTTTFE